MRTNTQRVYVLYMFLYYVKCEIWIQIQIQFKFYHFQQMMNTMMGIKLAGEGIVFLFLFFATCQIVYVETDNMTVAPDPPSTDSMYEETSDNVTVSAGRPSTIAMYHHPSCNSTIRLPVSNETRDAFKVALTNNSVFAHVAIHFNNVSHINELNINESLVINPLTWVWALEGKGYVLLTYPYDFEYLSLTTLSPGVDRVELAVELNDEEKACFQEKNNEDREKILARFVTDVANEAIFALLDNKSSLYHEKEFQVCLEKKDTSSISLFALETLFSCTIVHDNHCVYNEIKKHNWPLIITYVVVILVLIFPGIIFPLGIDFFTCQNPPTEIEGAKWLTIGSDLPVGMKYFLLHSNCNSKWIGAIRRSLACILFTMAGTLLYIVPFAAKEEYEVRKLSQFLRPFPLWHLICTLYFLVVLLLIILANVFTGITANKRFPKGGEVQEYLDLFQRFKVPEEELRKIPKLHGSMLRKLKLSLYAPTHYLIRPRLWWKSLDSVERFKKSRNIKLFAFPFISLWFIISNLPVVRYFMLTILPAFPSSKYNMEKETDEESEESKYNPSCFNKYLKSSCYIMGLRSCYFIYLFASYLHLSVVCLCSSVFFLLLIGKIIAYTFTGLLLNYDYYLQYQYVYVLVGLAGAHMGSINFHDKYCVLHRHVLEQMFVVYEEKREEIEKLNKKIYEYPCSSEQNTDDNGETTDRSKDEDKDENTDKNNPDENEDNNRDENKDGGNPDENEDNNRDENMDEGNPDENTDKKNPQKKKDNEVFLYIRDIPHVSHDFFNTCCEIFQPVRVQVIKFVLAMSSIFLVVQFVASVLQSVQKEVELPEVLTNFLVPLFSVGIIPFLSIITTSKEQETCKEEEKILNIRKFMRRNLEMLGNGKGEYWSGMTCPEIKWHPSINELSGGSSNKSDSESSNKTKSNEKSIDDLNDQAIVKPSTSDDGLIGADLNTTQIENRRGTRLDHTMELGEQALYVNNDLPSPSIV